MLSGGVLPMDANVSSQFISSLMMVAPYTTKGITIEFKQRPVSLPYIQMTKDLMQLFGVEVELTDTFVRINPSDYRIQDTFIEPDWSSASYWYEMASLADHANLFLEGFTKNSVQGDSCVWQIFEQLGVHTDFKTGGIQLTAKKEHTDHFIYNFTDAPDLVPAVLTTCAAKKIKATITGVDHLKHKESDRMMALETELAKIGAVLVSENESYHLKFNKNHSPEKKLVFNTYKDHRMAMCFSALVLKFDNVLIQDKEVVEKSYPAFWNDLRKLKIVKLNS
jgi:3-phosphoshikimate 1-carboxyvinyltransferase